MNTNDILRDIDTLFDNMTTLDENNHALERKMEMIKQNILGELQQWMVSQLPSKTKPKIRSSQPRVDGDDDDDNLPPPPPKPTQESMIVEPWREKIVPVDVQIDRFAVNTARIRLADDFETLRDRVMEVFEYCRSIKAEMRGFNAVVGLVAEIYKHMIINGVQLENCAIPDPEKFIDLPIYIDEQLRENGENARVIMRLMHEFILEWKDQELQQFHPESILIPSLNVFKRMCDKLKQVLVEYPDTRLQGTYNFDDVLEGFMSNHIQTINGRWRIDGWRVALGAYEIDRDGIITPIRPCLLWELFIDC